MGRIAKLFKLLLNANQLSRMTLRSIQRYTKPKSNGHGDLNFKVAGAPSLKGIFTVGSSSKDNCLESQH